MMFDVTWLAIPTIAALSIASERILEQARWFQRQSPETKRLLAILVALAIGFGMAQLEQAAGAKEDLKAIYAVLAAFVQQFAHAFGTAHEDNAEEK